MSRREPELLLEDIIESIQKSKATQMECRRKSSLKMTKHLMQ